MEMTLKIMARQLKSANEKDQIIVKMAKRMDVLCFGGEDWWYHNRGHVDMQLMRRFGRNGAVLYVNSIVMQKPRLGKGNQFGLKLKRKVKSIWRGLRESGEGFWVYSPVSLPVHHVAWLRGWNQWLLKMQVEKACRKVCMKEYIVWVVCPAACEMAIQLEKSKLVYQRTDRFEEYPNVDQEQIGRYDRIMKEQADLTIFVNRKLFEEEKVGCRHAVFLDHGVDYTLFSEAEEDDHMPEEMKGLKRPVVGFFGGIDNHTSDMELIEQVVERLPEMQFVLIGKASVDCTKLASFSNVRMLGQKPYSEIPHYGKCCNVLIMPWQQNRWIEACNPIKLKEYLALGKPVVSTPFPELEHYAEVTYTARGADEFASTIRRALAEDREEKKKARQEKVKNATWDQKANDVMRVLFGQE